MIAVLDHGLNAGWVYLFPIGLSLAAITRWLSRSEAKGLEDSEGVDR